MHRIRDLTAILSLAGSLCFTAQIHADDIIARYSGEVMADGGGARALALGGATAALTTDVWSLFWNPAGLAAVTRSEAGLMHSERFAGVVDYDVAGVAMPQPDGTILAGGMIRLGVNGIPFTRLNDPSKSIEENDRVDIDRVVNAGDYVFFVGKASTWGRWRWGLAPKLWFRSLGGGNRGYGLGLDAGVQGRPVASLPVDMGLSARDVLGTVVAWEKTGRKEILPTTLRLGLAAGFDISSLEARITPAVDGVYRFENLGGSDAADWHAGLEYLIRDAVALRIGSDDGRMTYGGGVQMRALSFDYAWIGHDELGETHRVSVNYRWGK